MKPRLLFHRLLKLSVYLFGTHLVDVRTGKKVAKALMICFGGKIYLFGLEGNDQVIPLFLPQKKMSFWKREIGFITHPSPDFSSEYKSQDPDEK